MSSFVLFAKARFYGISFLLILLTMFQGHAQDTLRTRYGLLGGYSINLHTADFRALPGVPNCCPRFESGSGGGFLAGALMEVPLSSSLLLSLRGSYVIHNATLLEHEPVTVIVNGVLRNSTLDHTVDATLSSIGLEPALRVHLFGDAFASIGVRGATYLAKSYTQEERTNAGTYLDSNGVDTRSRVRNQSSGDLPDAASFLLEGIGGISYDLPLNKLHTLLLAPEIAYALPLTNVVKNIQWKANGLRAGIALKFSPISLPPKPVEYDTVIVRDTTTQQTTATTVVRTTLQDRTLTSSRMEGLDTILVRTTIQEHYLRETPAPSPPPPMTCSVKAAGVDDNGNETPMATLQIEEFLSTVAHPLLNYIFFDRNSAQLAERYTKLTSALAAGFHTEQLYGAGTLPVYYAILNIIGQRMQKYPKAVLTLTGCNMDQEEEKGNTELSRQRAEAVREYVTTVWSIERSRIQVEAVNLPAKRSNPITPDGQAENRRVEITSNIPEILDVLIANDTLRTVNPPILRLFPTISSAQSITSWELSIAQHGVLKQFTGTGALPASLDWDLVNDQAHIPRFNDPLVITFHAVNTAGEKVACQIELPTQVTTIRQKRENRVGDYTIDRFNLILFNVGESGITSHNQRVVDLVKSRLKPSSELTIEGFADRSGNAAGNQRLSASRAKMTAEALGRPKATTRGIGESRLLYSNDIPEGRFYCRTVQILMKTPVGK